MQAERASRPAPFDLQAHRGGAGLHPENTLQAFGAALALGVSTLELDVHLTAEDDVVVSHDPALADARLIRDLTRADLPASMPLLRDVAALLEERGATGVWINLEIKYDALAAVSPAQSAVSPAQSAVSPAQSAVSRAEFVQVVVEAIRIDGLVGRTSIQCFDWEVLDLVSAEEPHLPRNVLASNKYLQPGKEGASPWLGGLDIDDFAGDSAGGLVQAAVSRGFDAISPIHGSPYTAGVADPSYSPFTTAELVDAAHHAGLRVIPYTVDDVTTMRHLVELGVDGLITNRPDRLRGVLAELGLALPPQFPPHSPQ